MIELIKYFSILFMSPKISRERLKDFTESHIARLTANNPAGVFTTILTNITTAYNSYFGDLSSDYARLSPATRMGAGQDALPFLHRQSHYYEKGQLALGQPPWQDPQKWVRNSPYYQAGRVQLPVLLISGSQDGHLAQSEQFFTALYRQGKPARLVRYQDESNRVERADHVVDEWHQIHTWLQRYLGDQSSAGL